MTKKFVTITWCILGLAIGLNVLMPTIAAFLPALFKLAGALALIVGITAAVMVWGPRFIKWLKNRDNH